MQVGQGADVVGKFMGGIPPVGGFEDYATGQVGVR